MMYRIALRPGNYERRALAPSRFLLPTSDCYVFARDRDVVIMLGRKYGSRRSITHVRIHPGEDINNRYHWNSQAIAYPLGGRGTRSRRTFRRYA